MNIERIVLKSSVSRADIQQLSWQQKWILEDEIEHTEDTPYQLIWLTLDKEKAVHYIEDDQIEVHFLEVRGDEIGGVSKQIQASLTTITLVDIRNQLDQGDSLGEQIRAVYALSLLAPQAYEQGALALFTAAFTHWQAVIRQAAVFAASYTIALVDYTGAIKEELMHMLNQVAKQDADEEVRDYASSIFEELQNEERNRE